MADNSTTLPTTDLKTYALSGKLMCLSVITILAILLLFICFHFYARFRSLRPAQARPDPQPHKLRRPCRLPTSLLKSVPTFHFSAGAHPRGLECVVCLSEFQEAETGRVLPGCRHCFHIDCIDTWFRAHSNCPLCRAPVDPSRKNRSAEVVIQIRGFCAADDVGSGTGLVTDPPGPVLAPVE